MLAILLAGAALAADKENKSVVSLTVQQINSDQSQLQGQQYVSSGQPTSETLALVAEAGFVAVVDMRTAEENRGIDEEREASELGMAYVSIPVGGPDDVSFENAAELDRVLAELDGPVLLHCASGNRVGALFALRAKLNGASNEDALIIGRQAGLTGLESVVEGRLAEDD
jgi:uncharacterized protein (TIGR01244 family)